MKTFSRRSFLKTAGLATAAASFSARSWSQVAGANSEVRIAVVGLHGRGKDHIKQWKRVSGGRLVALCDADTAVLEKAAAGLSVATFQDVRELLKRSDIDAISIATPNHWHSLLAIWACQAGKDVYVEKPVSHNVWEGRQLVAATLKYPRIVQAGTQCRSNPGITDALAWVRAGNLGKITLARGLCYKRRKEIGKSSGPQAVPSTVNYDLWLGPAPMQAPRRKQFHYDWHWFWATGNGDLGNQGIHQMDLARLFLGEPGLPRHAWSVGGRVGYDDDGETANTQVMAFDYERAPLVFEVRGLPSGRGSDEMDKLHGSSIGLVLECEGGRLVIADYISATAFDTQGRVVRSFKGEGNHFQNFVDCVHSRRSADLHGPVQEGHVSSALCHLGNVSHQLGASLSIAQIREKIQGNSALAEASGRMEEHLNRNGVAPGTPLVLGEMLAVDPAAERFVGNPAADRLLTRDYRAPYTVPALA